jgi:hypothetical protein
MIEVFKTDVECQVLAVRVLDRIHGQFDQYLGNFDLQDCDRVLRITSPGGIVSAELIDLLQEMGVRAEVLHDNVPIVQTPLTAGVDHT